MDNTRKVAEQIVTQIGVGAWRLRLTELIATALTQREQEVREAERERAAKVIQSEINASVGHGVDFEDLVRIKEAILR